MKQIIYFLQYIGFIFIYFLYKILPLNLSLKVSSFLFRTFGKFSRANKTAINNCKYVFPNLKDEEIQNIIKKSWNNLGITICELLRINDIFIKNKIKYINLENIEDFIKNKKQAIFISIHQSNWEVLVPGLDRIGINIGGIYRHINNNFIDKLILNIRQNSLVSKNSFYTPKGKKSAKDNNGNIELTFLEPLYHNNLEINDTQMMEKIHNKIEQWIKAEPSQWFWQHKRFS